MQDTYINYSTQLNDNENENVKQVEGVGDICYLISVYCIEISVSKQDKLYLFVRYALI